MIFSLKINQLSPEKAFKILMKKHCKQRRIGQDGSHPPFTDQTGSHVLFAYCTGYSLSRN